MSLTLCLASYFVIWWITLFAVLPFGLRTQEEEGDIIPGTPESAPARPRLLRTFLINSIVAAIVFAFVWVIVTFGLIDVGAFKPPVAP
jgi:predicted secreted protein